jgi:hypothetical protein
MSSEDFNAEAVAARAAGEFPDAGDDSDGPDSESVDDAGDEELDVADTVATILLVLVAADERGPTAPTIQQKLDVDQGVAMIVDGATDIVLEIVDTDVGDTVGPMGKIAVGVSRMGDGTGSAATSDQAAGDGGEDNGPFSSEAQALMRGDAGV